ncbi:hypothetical protein, partial [Rhizobium leguminosarum]|uniref:hypothetical protein n=1 Tax=Rhizobium leguminosarum TaxID=384 RepID=UPI001A8D8BCD
DDVLIAHGDRMLVGLSGFGGAAPDHMVARNLLRKHVKLVLPFLPQKLRREFAYFKTRHDLDQPCWWGAISANLLSKSYNREVYGTRGPIDRISAQNRTLPGLP